MDVEDLDMTFCSEAHLRARMAEPLPAPVPYPVATKPSRSRFPYWLVALGVAILVYSALAAVGAVAIHHWYVDR
jgi:hypothetical protein